MATEIILACIVVAQSAALMWAFRRMESANRELSHEAMAHLAARDIKEKTSADIAVGQFEEMRRVSREVLTPAVAEPAKEEVVWGTGADGLARQYDAKSIDIGI